MKSFKTFLNETSSIKNKGIRYEVQFNRHLYKHGLMASSKRPKNNQGNDFHLINKKEKIIHRGKVYDGKFIGETKMNATSASFGQIALNWDPVVKKWGISHNAYSKRPEFASTVEKAKITHNGVTKSLIDHVNDTVKKPKPGNIASIFSDQTNMKPAHAYGRDHGADVIHIGKKGTYRFGNGEHRDRTRIGLPKLSGHGQFEVRRKYPKNGNSLHVAFKVKGKSVDRSHIDLENEEHVKLVKKALGHE